MTTEKVNSQRSVRQSQKSSHNCHWDVRRKKKQETRVKYFKKQWQKSRNRYTEVEKGLMVTRGEEGLKSTGRLTLTYIHY